jgi:hypothetical protein
MGARVVPLVKIKIKRRMTMDGKESLVSETVAALKGIPTEEELIKMLREQTLVVTFLKLDGEQRVMTCTKSWEIIPESKRPSTAKDPKPGTINVWDINADNWRSFRYDRVQKVDKV